MSAPATTAPLSPRQLFWRRLRARRAAMAGGVSAAEQVEKAVLQHIGNIETKLISFDWKGREVA